MSSPVWTARVWAWNWLFLYVALVPGLLVTLWMQWRQPAAPPTPRTALPASLRVAQCLLGGLMAVMGAVMGAALFLAPGSAEQLWPWPLTPLTARMVGSFDLAFGVSLFAAARENDYVRIRVASFAYVVFAVLQLVTALRYPGADWLAFPGLLLGTMLLGLFVIGSAGVRGAR